MIFLLTILFSITVHAKNPIKVAVLDSGFDFKSTWQDAKSQGLVVPKLCKEGHKDFTNTNLNDNHGHGTHVAGIIAKYAGNADYCLVILKIYDPKTRSIEPEASTTKAMRYARAIGASIINYSGGGVGFNIGEYIEVKKNLDSGIVIVAAAGNEKEQNDYQIHSVKFSYFGKNSELAMYRYTITYINRKTLQITDKAPKNPYYPAAYDPRIISVMSYDKTKRHSFSNYGAAYNSMSDGYDILSLMPDNMYGKLSGTSMAAPKKTGQIIENWDIN